MKRAIPLLLILSCSKSESPVPEWVASGITALRRLQESDGAWRSRLYPDMKTGLPLTALALFTLSRIPGSPPNPIAVEFLSKHLDANGQVGNEYPNFTTGMTLRAFRVYKPGGWEEMTKRMGEYLVRAQETESAGWTPSDPAYGSWGLGGLPPRQRQLIRQDISSTRFALEALAEAGRIAEVSDKARGFILRCQAEDGGFFYSKATVSTNKAGEFRSYGSATADGILALRCLVVQDVSDIRHRDAALSWLGQNFSVDRVPGFDPKTKIPWDGGILFYYLYAAAAALEMGNRGRPIVEKIRAMQAPDGSWTNPVNVMKEDDPVIATCFALLAWSYASR